MPEAVTSWIESGVAASPRQVHRDLIDSLAEDLQKYRGVGDVSYLEAAFENLRHHYGLRFKYENFAPGYRSQLMKSALWQAGGCALHHPRSTHELPRGATARANALCTKAPSARHGSGPYGDGVRCF